MFRFIPITFPLLSTCLVSPWLSWSLKGYHQQGWQPGWGAAVASSSSSPQEVGKLLVDSPSGPWPTGDTVVKWQVSPPIFQLPTPMHEPISSGVTSSQSPYVISMLGLWDPQKVYFSSLLLPTYAELRKDKEKEVPRPRVGLWSVLSI